MGGTLGKMWNSLKGMFSRSTELFPGLARAGAPAGRTLSVTEQPGDGGRRADGADAAADELGLHRSPAGTRHHFIRVVGSTSGGGGGVDKAGALVHAVGGGADA